MEALKSHFLVLCLGHPRTPLIVQIFIIFFGLAYVGIILDPIPGGHSWP